MNYFKKHLGDYAKKTGHLSPLEHGVYGLIMDAYYDREQGPTLVEATRYARARTEEEKAAVLAVLDEFFTLGPDERYIQNRIEDELATYRAQAEVNRVIAVAREQKKRERLANEQSTNRAPVVHDNEQVREPSHKPIANSHKPIEEQTTCAAAPAATADLELVPPAAPAEPPAYTLPTNAGDEFPIARQRVEEFVELYPGVDVMQELRKMRGWLISNPAKRKTKKGMMSFVNNWLSKQQNAAGAQQQIRRIGPASGRPSINDIGVAPGADNDIFKQMRTEL